MWQASSGYLCLYSFESAGSYGSTVLMKVGREVAGEWRSAWASRLLRALWRAQSTQWEEEMGEALFYCISLLPSSSLSPFSLSGLLSFMFSCLFHHSMPYPGIIKFSLISLITWVYVLLYEYLKQGASGKREHSTFVLLSWKDGTICQSIWSFIIVVIVWCFFTAK